jgi:hypothetical protein
VTCVVYGPVRQKGNIEESAPLQSNSGEPFPILTTTDIRLLCRMRRARRSGDRPTTVELIDGKDLDPLFFRRIGQRSLRRSVGAGSAVGFIGRSATKFVNRRRAIQPDDN